MKPRLLILPLFLLGSLSLIYFLPQAGAVADSAIKMELPGTLEKWHFQKIPPSKAELEALAKDTEFSKARCLKARPGEFTLKGYPVPDQVDLSIVLSGYDLNNSIHRPERCMPAQGHTILSSTDVTLKLQNGRDVTLRRLRSTQTVETEGGDAQLNCITYYFFVGHDQLIYDHLQRTIVDMKDRLIHGMDQRWAYVSASTWFGKIPIPEVNLNIPEEEADAKLQAFLGKLMEDQIKWEQIKP